MSEYEKYEDTAAFNRYYSENFEMQDAEEISDMFERANLMSQRRQYEFSI